MNKVILMGHIGKIADMKSTQQSKILSFTLATKDAETSWHRCTVFNGVAETVQKHCKVGDKILVEGKIKYNSYEVEGQKRMSTEIYVYNIEFCSSKGSVEQAPPEPQAHQPKADAQAPSFTAENNGDLPF